MRLDAKDLAHGVEPPVLLHPLLVVGDEQPSIVDPSRVNPCLLEFQHKFLLKILHTDLLKPGDDLPGVREQLDLGVVGSEAPEEAGGVPSCS